jgi:hypothetical protein
MDNEVTLTTDDLRILHNELLRLMREGPHEEWTSAESRERLFWNVLSNREAAKADLLPGARRTK